MKVKICGISNLKHAQVAAAAGADFIGFVFAESKRQVSPEKAKEIISSFKHEADFGKSKFVGVFVNSDPDSINRVAEKSGLDFVQLSGDESPEFCSKIALPVIKAVRPRTADEAWKVLEFEPVCETILFDTFHQGSFGGSGITGDWTIAAEAAKMVRLILAGGLTPENVVDAADAVSPWGVDVSSGVETNGVKDEKKIIDFIRAVRSRYGN